MLPSEGAQQSQALHELLEAFELAWQAGSRPSIAALLDDPRVPRRQLLCELVHTELEYRCKAGEDVRVEEYLERFPELGEDTEVVVELIVAEFEQRRQRQAAPCREDYLKRFAQYREQLLQPLSMDPDDTLIGGEATAPAPNDLPTSLGRYRIDEQIARGGMGRVVRVWDGQFDRPLALKLFALEGVEKFSGAERLEMEQRFEREAQLTGQMQHPGIPPVQERGRLPDGRPYFIMKLVKGQSLSDLLKERAGPDRDLPRFVDIFQSVCDTLAYAHSRGILHRDLKPGNIMVGAFGEVQVMDWGLAKLISAAESPPPAAGLDPERTFFTIPSTSTGEETSPGSILGTPAYLAPEQARGEVEQLDARCDVFGLGGILCTMLTGKPPFAAGSPLANHRLAMQGDLADAFGRLDQCGAEGELARLAKDCLAPKKAERLADAGAVAVAVRRYQAAVQDRLRQAELDRKAAEVRAAEERKRRRVALRLGGVIAALVLAIGIGAWWVDRSATKTRLEREEQQVRAREAVGALFVQLDQALAAGKADQAERVVKLIQERLAGMDAADLQQRLKESATDLAMLRALDRLFAQRWQVVEQAVIEQLHHRQGASAVLTMGHSRLGPAGLTAALSNRELRGEYASAFAKHGLAVGQRPLAELVQKVRQSRIGGALVEGMDQWFLLEPESPGLLAALNAVDAMRLAVRQMLADRATGKPYQQDLAKVGNETHNPATVLYLSELLPEDRALALLKEAVRRAPDNHRLLTVLVFRLLLSGPLRGPQVPEALGYARALRALQPTSASACLLVTIAFRFDERWDEVIRHAHMVLEMDPKSAQAYNFLGVSHTNKGKYDQAMAFLNKALEIDPKYATAHNNLGVVYMRKKEYDQAIPHLKKAIALNPTGAIAHGNLGATYFNKKEHDRAILHLKKAIEIDSKLAAAHNFLSLVHCEKREFDRAIAQSKKALEIDPKNVAAHNNLGLAYNGKEDYDRAIPHLKKAIALDPKRAFPYNNLGIAYGRKKDYDRAIPYLQKAIALDPKNAFPHNNLGWSYAGKGEYDKAIVNLQEGIDLNPRLALPHYKLGFVLKEVGDLKRACQELKKALAGTPKTPKQIQEWKKLLDEWEGLLALEPRLAEIVKGEVKSKDFQESLQLGKLCGIKQYYSAAVRFYEQARGHDPDAALRLEPFDSLKIARVILLGADGKGNEPPPEAERPKYRAKALAWLRQYLNANKEDLEKDRQTTNYPVQGNLRVLLQHNDLASVCLPALNRLPAGERQEWESFWTEVHTLLRRAEAPLADPSAK